MHCNDVEPRPWGAGWKIVFNAGMNRLSTTVAETDTVPNAAVSIALFTKEWVVYVKPPFSEPKQVLSYLGRYTHRVAISNNRILQVDDKQVTFSWRDYHQDYKQIITTMKGTDFLKRFSLHILPPGFTRIRHYGFLSSAAKTKALVALREYFCLAPRDKNIETSWQTIVRERMGIEAQCCIKCGHFMQVVRTIPDRFHQPIRAPSYSAVC
jgi:hypothetical protein